MNVNLKFNREKGAQTQNSKKNKSLTINIEKDLDQVA